MKKKTPSLLHRDASNKLIDPNEGHKIAAELTKKLVAEQRAHEKDRSMHRVRTGKRDIVVHLAVTVLGSQDEHPIIGEQDREYNQWCFKIPARHLPLRNEKANRAFAELCHAGKQALMKLGYVID